jgi:hypothetical protein
MNSRRIHFILLAVVITSCSTIKNSPKYVLSDGKYSYKQPGEDYRKVYVYVSEEDSVSIFSDAEGTQPVKPQVLKDEYFVKRSFDLDVIAIPFKFRPMSVNLPRQLTTDFNGNIFLGYRIDRFRLVHKKTPIGWRRSYKHRGISFGGFGGLGSTAVTPWTTNYLLNDEYNGLVLSRGVAVMVGMSNLTVGVGIGWDSLTDRDKTIWIYQNKSWYGVTIGLNLN